MRSIRLFYYCIKIALAHILYILCHIELAFKFDKGSLGQIEKLDTLLIAMPAKSFRYI